jgi:hypothetical protein
MPVEQYTTLVGKHERGPAALSVPDDAAIENLGAPDGILNLWVNIDELL